MFIKQRMYLLAGFVLHGYHRLLAKVRLSGLFFLFSQTIALPSKGIC